MNLNGRALHFVFKVGDRAQTIKFYKDVLGMKILRHEEFTEGCDAKCNGPYDNRWSKTMVGYGIEDTHFVVELTYNYNVNSYNLGNDFLGLTIKSSEAIANAKKHNWPIEEKDGCITVKAPGGYRFYLLNEPQPLDKDPVQKVSLASSNLPKSIDYWNGILGLKLFNQSEKCAVVGFDETQAKLKLIDIGSKVEHETAYGRIAFSVPFKQLSEIDKRIKETNQPILTQLITLDTPGKATVTVIILADPDGHEICFVDDEGFRDLSKFDPDSDTALIKYMKKDAERVKPE